MAKFRRLLFALVSVGLCVAAPTASWAQSRPHGSYLRTCNNIRVVSNVLVAICDRADGSWAETALPNPGACEFGVRNVDGELSCDISPTRVTSRSAGGRATLTDPCGGQEAVYMISTSSRPSDGFVVHLKPGQSVDLDVLKGSTYVSACGQAPTDTSRVAYFDVVPAP